MKRTQMIIIACIAISVLFVLFSFNYSHATENTLGEQINNSQEQTIELKLTEDVTEDITIPNGKIVTIDLNGFTLTTATQIYTRGIQNYGTLIIKATNGGTITNSSNREINKSYGIIDNRGGTVIIEGGNFLDYGDGNGATIKNRNGKITINGGKFSAFGTSPQVKGDNNTGGNACINSDGELTIADGVSFTSQSKAAYPVIISSGTGTIGKITVDGVKGGIGINSGTVTIAGGTFKGHDYYGIWITNDGYTDVTINGGEFTGNYGLRAKVDDGKQDAGDANIVINGGTFIGITQAAVAMQAGDSINKWGMNITGGTFSTPIEESYVADKDTYTIYEIKKEGKTFYSVDKKVTKFEQKENLYLEVGKTAKIGRIIEDSSLIKYANTTVDNDKVIKLENDTIEALEVGEATITTQIGEKTKETKVVTYKSDASKNTAQDKQAKETVTNIIQNILEGKDVDGITSQTAQKVKEAVLSGKEIKTSVEINTIKEEQIKSEDISKIQKIIGNGEKLISYYDIDVVIKNSEGQELGNVTKLNNRIAITLEISKDLPELEEDMQRIYSVIRIHDGEIERLEANDNGDGTITFYTDAFSTYVTTYTDKTLTESTTEEAKEETNTEKIEISTTTNPKTGDYIIIACVVLAISIIGFTVTIKSKKKK